MKIIIIILFFSFFVFLDKGWSFKNEITDYNISYSMKELDKKILEESLDSNHFDFLVNQKVLELLQMEEKEFNEFIIHLNFLKLMNKQYRSEDISFNNS